MLNHISDFGSLGGVQTYLYSLKRKRPKKINLISIRKPLNIYLNKNRQKKEIRILTRIKTIFCLLRNRNICHNLILSNKWPLYVIFLKLFNKKIIYHEHGVAWHNPNRDQKKYLNRIKNIDYLIVNSNATKKLLQCWRGLPLELH